MDLYALTLVSGGSFLLGAIGGHLVTEQLQRRKVDRLERDNARLIDRNVELREITTTAIGAERDALTALHIVTVQRDLAEAQQAGWARRLLDMKAELDRVRP